MEEHSHRLHIKTYSNVFTKHRHLGASIKRVKNEKLPFSLNLDRCRYQKELHNYNGSLEKINKTLTTVYSSL